ERTVDLDRLFGRRHAFVGASVCERATGDGKIGEKPRLKAEVADAARNVEATAADFDRSRWVHRRVEYAQIGVAAAGGTHEAGGFCCLYTPLDLADRFLAAPDTRQRNAFRVERLGRRKGGFAPAFGVDSGRHVAYGGECIVGPLYCAVVIAGAE